jgi:hypothetical protein
MTNLFLRKKCDWIIGGGSEPALGADAAGTNVYSTAFLYSCTTQNYVHSVESARSSLYIYVLKGVCHETFRVLFWHVWIDLGLYKNL